MRTETIRIIIGLITSIAGLILWPRYIKLNPFFSLLATCFLFSLIAGMPMTVVVPAMQTGFDNLLQQIGMIIALGSVLGTLLEKTGATEVISTGLLNFFGPTRSVLAIAVIGTLVGVPVFCDSGFILLSKLIPTLALKTSASQGSLVLALSSSLYTTHSLVPPTPGPLAAAAALGLGDDFGFVILLGLLGSLPVVLVAYWYAKKFGTAISGTLKVEPGSSNHPPIRWLHAFLPLALPILLITIGSFVKLDKETNFAMNVIATTGIPLVALLIGVLLCFTLIDRRRHSDWPRWVTDALKDAGIIILVIGAGGAFGAVIKASGLDQLITGFATHEKLNGVFFLFFAWCIAAIFKIAQGSTTSSMVITSAMLAPLAADAGMISTLDKTTMVLAIGGGAMTVSHANDAYFWVVSQFGGISTPDAFRWYTPMTLVQGITTLVTALFIYVLLG